MPYKLYKSDKPEKRFKVTSPTRTYYFGDPKGSTYIDHGDKTKRANYWARHLGNKKEAYLIKNLIPSPTLFAAYILWGDSTDIHKNFNLLKSKLK